MFAIGKLGPRRLVVVRAWFFVSVLAAISALGSQSAAAQIGDLRIVANTGRRDFGEVDNLRHRPAISADGRFIAYVAQGEGGDPLYLRDMRARAPVPVDVPAPTDAERSNSDSFRPDLSADGRYLAFASEDPRISDEDVDDGRYAIQDAFVYDRLRKETTLVSRRSGRHGEPADNNSNVVSISEDGRAVVYDTESDNLSETGNVVGGVYRRDLATDSTELVSGAPGIQFWSPVSFAPDISGNGRRVAFGMQYSPTPYDPDFSDREALRWLHRRHRQIMLADPNWREPRVVSRASGRQGAIANDHCRTASASRTGRFVAFTSAADNLVRGDDNEAKDVFVRDTQRNRTFLVSRRGLRGAPGDADSVQPSVSADGRYVAFLSAAENLVPKGGGEKRDVFVKDLLSGRLTLVSRGAAGERSNGRSGGPMISASGRIVAFGSTASNLSPGDPSHDLSFFRYQLLP